MTEYDYVDTFAGPGGWDIAAQALGLRGIGIEHDPTACNTRRAAELPTIQGDVTHYSPNGRLIARGHIGSPPCQTFSNAGNGAGRKALDQVLAFADLVAVGMDTGTLDWTGDPRTLLVLEPLRWALEAYRAGNPYQWIALEQVPAVLPVWERFGEYLTSRGYSVATGVLNAEQYGVPQTRRRAVLMARLDGPVQLPTPTHSRYYPRDPARLDLGVPSWVSMSQALGWTDDVVVGLPRLADSDDTIEIDGTLYRRRDLRPSSEPAQTLTSKARSWQAYPHALIGNQYPNGPDGGRQERDTDHPAQTVTAKGARSYAWGWLDRPANTICAGTGGKQSGVEWGGASVRKAMLDGIETGRFIPRDALANWPWFRAPGTTVAGDPRITAREHHNHGEQGKTSLRITVAEAAVLQTFPPDYPWQGTLTKQYEQVGNAIPPLLAWHILRTLTTTEGTPNGC